MSNRAITWAYGQQGLKGGPKFVLVTLADMADQEHSCIPGIKLLARLTGFGETAVKAHVAVLTAAGLIRRESRFRKDGSRTSSRYYLDVDGALAITDPRSESDSGQPGDQSRNPTGGGSESDATKAGIRPPILEPQVNPKTEPPVVNDDQANFTLVALDDVATSSEAGFETFWTVWPRKDGKKTALAAWAKAIKRAKPEAIVAAAAAYSASPYRPDRQFVPHASTWLNGDRWDDPLPEPPEQRTAPPVRHPSVQAGLDLVRQFDHTGDHDEPAGSREALGTGHDAGPHHPYAG